jgi:hypothetical protein
VRHWVKFRKLVANLFIFLVAFFLTTPQLIVHQLDPIMNALKNITGEHKTIEPSGNSSAPHGWDQFRSLPGWLTDFLPTLAIWSDPSPSPPTNWTLRSFTALLPVVVAYADLLVGHWTR